ncbi:GGDEF domain-containing protein [Fastidiosibacter lacustris]|uniref:GGDEF domain-containing protein n=1 Tax=Fastidiosibacter lacustris TaxID=2056695 RepID=UPI000E35373A|nr:GGDEF domain-containing protein [Fastidiosibacter lacustris]
MLTVKTSNGLLAMRRIKDWLNQKFNVNSSRSAYWHRIHVTLISLILVIIGNTIFGILHFLTEKELYGGIYSYCAVLSYLIPLAMLKARHYYLAKLTLGILFIVNTFIFTYFLYQPQLLNYLFFMVVPPFSNMIFEVNEHKTKWGLSLLSVELMLFCLIYPNSNYLIELTLQNQLTTNLFILITITVVIATTISVILSDLEYSEKQLELMAKTDNLTSLLNRSAFQDSLEDFKYATHQGMPYSVMFIDIDKFKNINDQYGHTVGDKVIQDVAKVLLRHTRKHDVVSRFGGDEYVILLSNIDQIQGEQIATRLNKMVLQEIPKIGNIQVTISIGIANSFFNSKDHHHFDETLNKADQALYQAKAQGANCVISLNV